MRQVIICANIFKGLLRPWSKQFAGPHHLKVIDQRTRLILTLESIQKKTDYETYENILILHQNLTHVINKKKVLALSYIDDINHKTLYFTFAVIEYMWVWVLT